MKNTDTGSLYIVATPIGNLGDMVPRAIEVLQMVDYIAAEDTRHSARLLQHFSIDTPLIAYHDYSDERRLSKLLEDLEAGQSIALISDAGTPLISDPGYPLVNRARDLGVPVIPIPGACALVAALSASGLPAERFVFEGFLPPKSGARKQALAAIAKQPRTVIFYESPHRILASLHDIQEVLGKEREVAIARELTKTYETILSGSIASLIEQVTSDTNQQRGEFVVMIKALANKPTAQLNSDVELMMSVLLTELPTKQAASIAAKITGLKKRDLYQWALKQE